MPLFRRINRILHFLQLILCLEPNILMASQYYVIIIFSSVLYWNYIFGPISQINKQTNKPGLAFGFSLPAKLVLSTLTLKTIGET